jgi:catechol-2,3-dioxygenase
MPIQRVETLTYGVDDMETCVRYWEDIGLEKLEAGAAGALFRTPTNQLIFLRRRDDPALPRVPESGPTMREVAWGVDSKAGLDALGAELSKDRDVKQASDGVLHAHDETGFAIAFRLTDPAIAAPERPRYNNYDATQRLNQRVAHRGRAKPTRIGHVVYLIKPEGREKASAFYLDRLGFRLTDRSMRVGDFMRVGGTADHHSVLLMWIRQVLVRFDHAALELPGLDDIFTSGAYMSGRGWQGTWGPGRQSLGSHVFWHFANPGGGEIEYFTDMDRFDETWEPKIWTDDTPGNVWGEPPPEMRGKAGRAAPAAAGEQGR